MIKRFCLTLILCFIMIGSSAVAKSITPAEVKSYPLLNGQHFWLMEDHYLPIISIRISFTQAGAAYDPQAKSGLANMVSSLLDEGAGDLSGNDYNAALEGIATSISFNVDQDNFYIQMTTLKSHLEEAMQLLQLAITKPSFQSDAIERIRKQLQIAITRKKESPTAVAAQALNQLIYGSHPYARPLEGTLDSIANISRNDLANFAAQQFAQSNLKISVVGDVDAKDIKLLLDKLANTLPKTQAKQAALPEATFMVKHLTIQHIPMAIPQSIVLFAMPGPLRSAKDFYPTYVMNYVLGDGGFESRLMKDIRVNKGLAYTVDTSLDTDAKSGLIIGYAATRNERVDDTVESLKDDITIMHENGVTEQELKDAQNYLIRSFPLKMTKNRNLAMFLDSMQRDKLGIDFLQKRNSIVSSVTQISANQAAAKWLDPNKLAIVIVGGGTTNK